MELSSEVSSSGALVVILKGRLDINGTMEIEEQFLAGLQGHRAVIIDMSGVEFLASMGLRTIIMGAKALNTAGGRMVLLRPTENVIEVLKASGTMSVIPVSDSLADAEKILLFSNQG